MTVLIAGGGIAGLTLGLTLEQIGVPFKLYESTQTFAPRGVGINLQPNAVRELFELGLENALDNIGIRTQEYGLFTKTGQQIWTEPRGVDAGYRWPQFSVHRGELQMLLLNTLKARVGEACIVSGHKATGFILGEPHVQLTLETALNRLNVKGELLIAADGIHSTLRAQMYPNEGDPVWDGRILFRAISAGKPFRTGASMILAGHDTQRFVAYPITHPNSSSGLAEINWIAEITVDNSEGWQRVDWDGGVDIQRFLPLFEDWNFDWLPIPELIKAAHIAHEYPMIDRDPLPQWTQGRVTLMGDAAHPAYPVGSNGASQAIMDARILGASIVSNGLNSEALQHYEAQVRPQTSEVVLANRHGGGPDAVLQMVEDRLTDPTARVESVISKEELASHAASYKSKAGFAIDALNHRDSIIPR